LFFQTFLMFGVSNGLPARRPDFPGVELGTGTGYYYVILLVSALCCAAVMIVRRCRLGRLLRALADSPDALNAHGANTNLTRLFVFAISAFLAGIGGALASPVTESASGVSFDFSISLLLIAVMFISGRQPILSPVIAAFLYIVTPGYITNAATIQYTQVVFGAAAIWVAISGGIPALGKLGRSRRTLERAGRSPLRERLRPLAAGGRA
jgi:ABC-type branched-subunit amino acid transport system permease subunit